jgi:hypothetical protein
VPYRQESPDFQKKFVVISRPSLPGRERKTRRQNSIAISWTSNINNPNSSTGAQLLTASKVKDQLEQLYVVIQSGAITEVCHIDRLVRIPVASLEASVESIMDKSSEMSDEKSAAAIERPSEVLPTPGCPTRQMRSPFAAATKKERSDVLQSFE